ncbi:hypothetical protein [Ferruginibacter sp.]
MSNKTMCCGAVVRRRIAAEKIPALPNPKVAGGVAVIYVGSGNTSFKGTVSRETYYASDHSRHFKVHADDAPGILKQPYIILKP